MSYCPAVARFGDHLYAVVYQRRWLRKRLVLRCWECDLRIVDPRGKDLGCGDVPH